MQQLINKNIIMLFIAQIIGITMVIAVLNFAPLVGASLSDNPLYATLPIACTVFAAATTTGMISMIMNKYGRRVGFRLGAMAALIGACTAIYALHIHSFILFCVSSAIFGVFQASAQYIRFAAAESVPPKMSPKAIAYVLLGSVVGSILWPFIMDLLEIIQGFDLYSKIFIYMIIGSLVLQIPYIFMGSTKKYSQHNSTELDQQKGRSLKELMAQKTVWVAMSNAALGYMMMSLVMTATPLAMQICGFTGVQSAEVISLHVIGMFLPGLITGSLISRFGILPVLTLGHILFACAFVVANLGVELWHFTISLVLLGVGWNFLFIGGSSLLTRCYKENEQGKLQGVNETVIATMTALASFGSGFILEILGWQVVNQMTFAILLVAVVITFAYSKPVLHSEKLLKSS